LGKKRRYRLLAGTLGRGKENGGPSSKGARISQGGGEDLPLPKRSCPYRKKKGIFPPMCPKKPIPLEEENGIARGQKGNLSKKKAKQ